MRIWQQGGRSLLCVVSLLVCGAGVVHAASGTWLGIDKFWDKDVNWSGAGRPYGNQTATFNKLGKDKTTIDLNKNQYPQTLAIKDVVFTGADCPAYTLGTSGQTFWFMNSGTMTIDADVINDQTIMGYPRFGNSAKGDTIIKLINNSLAAKLIFNRDNSFWGNITGYKPYIGLRFEGVGDTTFNGKLAANNIHPFYLYNHTTGTITLAGAGQNYINRLYTMNSSALAGNTRIVLNSGSELLIDNGSADYSIWHEGDGVIEGAGTLRFGTGTGENFARVYIKTGSTLTIRTSFTSAGGLEMRHGSGGGTLVIEGINTMASNLIISSTGGSVSVAKIGNRGATDSNIGCGQRIQLTGPDSGLIYTGVGETTDRFFEFSNNARLDQSGSGDLILSEDLVVGANTKVLTLMGSTSGAGEIAGIIGPGSGITSLAKDGTGLWRLAGANTYAGATTIGDGTLALTGADGAITASSEINLEGGTLHLENKVDSNNADRLNDAIPLTLKGGTLEFVNNGGATDYSETAGTLTIGEGVSTVSAAQADEGYASTLTFASIIRMGGTVDFTGTGLGDSDRNRIFITGQADGLIGRWATLNGTSSAAYSSSLGVYAAGDADFTDIAAQGPDSVIPDDSAASVRINSVGVAGPITLAGGLNNSIGLLLQNTETNAIVAMRDGETNKTLLTDWVLIAQDKAPLILGAAADDGLLMPLDQGGELALENQSANATLTVNAVVTNNVSASSLLKTGAGNVTLAGAARYTGATLIDLGTLTFASESEQVLSSVISGAGDLVKTGAGALTLSGDNIDHTGETLINEGTLVVEYRNALGPTNGAGIVVAEGATLDMGGSMAANKLYMSSGTITVSGSGVDNKGAITCSSANSQNGALQGAKVSLAADATFGGNSRWGLWPSTLAPNLDLNNHTFNKVGDCIFNLVNVDTDPGAGHIVVQEGVFWLVYDTLLNGSAANTLTVQADAGLELFGLKYPQEWTLELHNLAQLGAASATDPYNIWNGPVNLHGTAFLTGPGGRSLRLNGQVSGDGSLVHRDALTVYLTHTNNIYTGATIISNGMVHVAHVGTLPGYAMDGKVSVETAGTLAVMTGDGVNGWSKEQLDTLRYTTTFGAAATLGIDTSFGDFVYDTDFYQAGISLVKYGTNTLTLAGVNTLDAVQVLNGALTLSNTSVNAFGSFLVTGGAEESTTVNIDGPTEIVDFGDLTHASTAGDRCVMNIASDLTLQTSEGLYGRFQIGSGEDRAGAVFQDAGAVTVGLGIRGSAYVVIGNSGGYGYYRMNGGSLVSGEIALGSSGWSTGGSASVFDLYDGELTVDCWCLLIAWGKGIGALNLFGGSFSVEGDGNEVIFGYTGNSAVTAQISLLGPNAKMFDRGLPFNKRINLARGGTNTLCAVNLNNGELTLYRVYAAYADRSPNTTTPSHFNFNGGLLKASASSSELMQGLTAAHVFPGGARIDTDGFDITINQPLIAPTGYGASNIALTSGGEGYIGSPAVLITGGSGIGATAIALADLEAGSPTCGQVTNILVTSAGSGYGASDKLTATLRGGGSLASAKLGSVTKSENISGGLTKTGAGTLTLGGANTYAGATVISNGTLKLDNAQALPAESALILDGGALDLNGFTVTNAISGSGGTVMNGTFHSEFSPAGINVIGMQALTLGDGASVSGAYLLDVTDDGASDLLTLQGDVDLSNIALQIVDQSQLNRRKTYTIAKVTGTLGELFGSTNLNDDRWHFSADTDGVVRLFFSDGLILILR